MSTEWIKPLEWNAEGGEPSDTLKAEGFKAGYKPPADVFNYFLHNQQKCTEQLQEAADNLSKDKVDKVEGKDLSTNDYTTTDKEKLSGIAKGAEVNQNAFSKVVAGDKTIEANSKTDTFTFEAGDNVTITPDATSKKVVIAAKDTTYSAATDSKDGLLSATDKKKLDNIDNTKDSEKSVKFASEAGEARKVKYALTVHFKGGDTEGTDKWTFDGSTSRSVNITPAKIGASAEGHTHSVKDVKDTVAATSTDGVNYTATVEGITELYNGMEITIIPNIVSASKDIKLNLNGLGAVPIRRPLSFSTFVATSIDSDRLYFLSANTPCRLMYHANYTTGGIWLMADKVKTSAQDLYGVVPLENGGTGISVTSSDTEETIKEKARANLGIINGIPVVSATRDTSTGNEVYKATVEGLGTSNLPIDGYRITIIPDSTSTNARARLQVNNQPSYLIKFRSLGKTNEVIEPTEPWIHMGVPITLTYSSYTGAWLTDILAAGTFAGEVVANASGQTPSTSLLRNSKLVSTETNPTVNGEICWTYE